MIEEHHKQYSRRHRIGSDLVAKSPMLDRAAVLEQMVFDNILSLYDARRVFVEDYSKSNRIHCNCKKVWVKGTFKTRCKMICRFSVLNLIKEDFNEYV